MSKPTKRKNAGGSSSTNSPSLSEAELSREAQKGNKLVHAADSAGGGTWVGKMITRTAVGLPLLFLFGWIISSHHVYICSLVVFIQVVAYRELVGLKYTPQDSTYLRLWSNFFNTYSLLIVVFHFYARLFLPLLLPYPVVAPLVEFILSNHQAFTYGAYASTLVMFVLTLRNPYYPQQYERMSWNIFVHVLVFLQTRVLVSNVLDGVIWFILPATLVIINDIVAYFAGLMFGRKILPFPFLPMSPNKTWEGFISAIPCTIGAAYIVSYFYAQFPWMICPRIDLVSPVDNNCVKSTFFEVYTYEFLGYSFDAMRIQVYSLIMGTFCAFVAPFAGFFTSGMKRSLGIKDFASLIPGHGGMTDRMDCQMLMGGFTFVLLRTLKPMSTAVMEGLWWKIEQLSQGEQRELFERLSIGLNFTRT